MIMKAPDEDEFFSSWLDEPPANEQGWTPPVNDWRFAPRQLGRHLRVDAGHRVTDRAPRMLNRQPAGRMAEAVDTLYFG